MQTPNLIRPKLNPKGFRQKYITATCHLGRQSAAYKTVREIYHVSSYCAATQTYWFHQIGFFADYYESTVGTQAFIEKAVSLGATLIHDLKQASIGDIVVTKDLNHNGRPDHVLEFLGWVLGKPGWAWVLDNHQPHKYQRNIIGGTMYTPGDYLLRLPN